MNTHMLDALPDSVAVTSICLLFFTQLLPTLDIYTWTEEHVVSVTVLTS